MKGIAGPNQVDLTYGLYAFSDNANFDTRLYSVMNDRVIDLAAKQVISIDVDTPIQRACTILGTRRIKKAPVLDGGKLVGTVSRRDITRSLMQAFIVREAGAQ